MPSFIWLEEVGLMFRRYVFNLSGLQLFLILLFFLLILLVSFYLGARFGPQALWGIALHQDKQTNVFSQSQYAQDIDELLAQVKKPKLGFYQSLKKTTPPKVYKNQTTETKPHHPAFLDPKEKVNPNAAPDPIGDLISSTQKQKKPETTQAEKPKPNQKYTLVLGRYRTKAKANKRIKELKKHGYFIRLIEKKSQKQKYWVCVGLYSSLEAAKVGQKRIQRVLGAKAEIKPR